MFCRVCGKSHYAEDNYCTKCGVKIRTGTRVDEPPEDEEPPFAGTLPNGPTGPIPPDQPAQNLHPFDIILPEDGIDLKKSAEDFERQLILQALEKTNWVKNRAASLLGLNRTTLVEKIKKMKIKNQISRDQP